MTIFKFRGLPAKQSASHQLIMISAKASDVLAFAAIDRVGRDAKGSLRGFQRTQIAGHIREIREYLAGEAAVLPNAIVIGFVKGVITRKHRSGWVDVTIDARVAPPGYVVDGQQRLVALAGLPHKNFELFVSLLICTDHEDLRRQFVHLNSARPIPKALVYELLPGTSGLPTRYSARVFAAAVTERLNVDPTSSLFGLIDHHTNPKGRISHTSVQLVIMRSLSDGAIRELPESKRLAVSFQLLSAFYGAVRQVFMNDWDGHTAKTSRLVHSAGIQALGYVMEFLVGRDGAQTHEEFAEGLSVLVNHTAWTSGSWQFSELQQIPWNMLQNRSREIHALAQHLVSLVRRETRRKFQLVPLQTGNRSATAR